MNSKGYTRKIIKIRADQSPNVKLALKEIQEGKEPSNTVLVPGIKDWNTYKKHRDQWDEMKQSIQLDAEFWEGEELFLFPRERLQKSSECIINTKPKSMGVDTAEGGDSSSWSIIGDEGLVELVSIRTSDTSMIPDKTIELIHKHKINPRNVAFDRGGGGKQHADNLRTGKDKGYRPENYQVRTIGFGEAAKAPKKKGLKSLKRQKEEDEQKYTYRNRRAQMYGMLSIALEEGFVIPSEFLFKKFREDRKNLYDQLRPIPKLLDREGQLYLLPKNKKDPKSKENTLTKLIGHSPDEADSLVLAVYCLNTLVKSGVRAIV